MSRPPSTSRTVARHQCSGVLVTADQLRRARTCARCCGAAETYCHVVSLRALTRIVVPMCVDHTAAIRRRGLGMGIGGVAATACLGLGGAFGLPVLQLAAVLGLLAALAGAAHRTGIRVREPRPGLLQVSGLGWRLRQQLRHPHDQEPTSNPRVLDLTGSEAAPQDAFFDFFADRVDA